MYLELDGSVLNLTLANGYSVQEFNLGYPSVRAVTDPRPLSDGMDDRTAYFGAKAVSLMMRLTGDKWDQIDQLGPFVMPDARPYLYYDDAAQPRRIRLRADNRTMLVAAPTNVQDVMLSWVAPDGIAETANENAGTALASAPVEPGFTFNLEFDITFPNASPVGTTTVTTVGNAKCYPTLRLYGPCTTPRIENVTDLAADGTAKRLTFDITLATGEYLEVDVRERTILLNGQANKSRYYTLDFSESEWWRLLPGANQVRYFPVSYSGNARAVILYRCSFI